MTDEQSQQLIGAALDARQRAYVPYSQYQVGAALRALDGTIFTGCNVENASYPASICAERTALVKAVSEGYKQFDAIVVATENGGTPCGICRQALSEFSIDMRVIIVDANGDIKADVTLEDLLPSNFSGADLPTET